MNKHKCVHGFTLIELLVVLFIISIVTSVALLSFSRNDERQMKVLANELAQMLALAQDRAMLETKVIGFSLDDHVFYFSSLEYDKKHKIVWHLLEDHGLAKYHFANDLNIDLRTADFKKEGNDDDEIDATEKMHDPQIIINTNRDVTPFTLYIAKRGDAPRFAVFGSADGSIEVKALSHD